TFSFRQRALLRFPPFLAWPANLLRKMASWLSHGHWVKATSPLVSAPKPLRSTINFAHNLISSPTEGRQHEHISQTCPGRWHHLRRDHLCRNRQRIWPTGFRHHHDR